MIGAYISVQRGGGKPFFRTYAKYIFRTKNNFLFIRIPLYP